MSTLKDAASKLSRRVSRLRFSAPVTHVYNPLSYAFASHAQYLERYGAGPKEVVFLGMNPGPFGMAQTGVPFGDIPTARDFLGIDAEIGKPQKEHPKRQVLGFQCPRVEVSGRRLWGAIEAHFGRADKFFARFFVANYCPLSFMEESGRNRTPDKLPAQERDALFSACDAHLAELVSILEPRWVIGIGAFAEKRAKAALDGHQLRFGRILHPSPASPLANRDWAGQVRKQLDELKICR